MTQIPTHPMKILKNVNIGSKDLSKLESEILSTILREWEMLWRYFLEKSKLWNFRLFSIPITFARKARGSSSRSPFCSPRPVSRRIGTRKSLWRTSAKVIIFICFVYIHWWIPCSLILKIITKLIQNVRNSGKRQSRWWFLLCTIAFVIYIYKMIEFHSNFMSFL